MTVHDGKDAADNNSTDVDAEITVTINLTDVNDAPVITSTGTAFTDLSSDENTLTTTALKTYAATDEDVPADTLSWSLEGTDAGDFDINSSTGAITFKNVPNYEIPADNGMDNVYNVTVKVTDNGTGNLSDTLAVTITVIDVNEAPDITTSDTTKNVPENTTAVLTFAATDADNDGEPNDSNNTLTWSVENTADGSKFTINSSGELVFSNAPDYETPTDVGDTAGNNTYVVTVKVTDNGIHGSRGSGNHLSDTHEITVTVDDVNEAPTITTSDTTKSVAENTTAVISFSASDVDDNGETDDSNNTLSWSVESAADGSKFSIDPSTGALTFSPAPDFETPTDIGDTAGNNTYVVTVKVTDNGIEGNRDASNHLNDTHEITVTVTNVNEAPTIDSTGTTHSAPSKMEIEYDDTSPNLSVVTYMASDPDTQTGNTLTWSIEGNDAGDFDIDSGSGALTFKDPPNFEMPIGTPVTLGDDADNTYEITVKVTDNGIPTDRGMATWLDATLDVVVTVTDVNERPDIDEDFDPPQNYTEVDFYYTLTPDAVHTFTATDYDDMGADPFTWSLGGDDMGDFSIGNTDGILTFNQNTSLNVGPLPSFEDPQDDDTDNTYEITVIATDDNSYAAEYAVTITVTDDEEAGAIAVVHTRNGQEIVGSDLTDLDVDDVLEFTLSDPDTIPTPLTDGAIDWVIERRNPGEMNWVPLTGQDVTSLTKEYTIDEDDTGKEIRATVTYTDRRGPNKTMESDNTDAAMDERAVAPPRFREGASQAIPEGPAGRDTEVEIMATDRDGEVLIFGIQDGPNSDLFEILPSDSTVDRMIDNVLYTGYAAQLRAIEALDYEALSPSERTIALTLTLSDGKAFSNGRVVYDDEVDVTYDVTIEVTDVEEPGEIAFSPEEVPETGVQIAATLADPDGSVSGETWLWQRSEDGESEEPAWDDISGATSATYTPSATDDVVSGGDNDGDGYYLRATVSYTDGEGSGKSATADAGQVGTANTRPQFPPAETGQRTVPENSRAGTNIGDPVAAEDPENNSLTYTLSELSEGLDDSEAFTIVSSTGQLRVKEPLDFENGQAQYIFNVDVHDRRDAAGRTSTHIDDTQLVIITVENVEEEGTVALTTDTNRIQATVPMITELSDPDIPNSGTINWLWARSTNRSDWEDIATGATYTPTVTDYGDADEEDQGNYLRATAAYTDGEGTDKTAEIVTSRVAAPPPTNAAPVFPDAADGQRELREDAGSGTLIGSPVQATDFNNDTLTYTLSGSDSSLFTIGANGQLSLQLEQDEALDYERKRTYRFTVQVSDGENDDGEEDDADNLRIDDSITVTVSLIDVNEPPVITGEAEREFRENGTSSVATYSARDPESDSISWSLSGLNSPNFVITDRGQLYFSEPPSFEDGDTHGVTVTATDDGEPFRSASLNVTVTVTDVEERGEIVLQPTRGWFADAVEDDPETMDTDETLPALQTRFTATLEDGDDVEGNISWQWSRSSSEDITDATSDSYKATVEDVNRTLRVTASYDDSDSQGDPVPESATAVLRSPHPRHKSRGEYSASVHRAHG